MLFDERETFFHAQQLRPCCSNAVPIPILVWIDRYMAAVVAFLHRPQNVRRRETVGEADFDRERWFQAAMQLTQHRALLSGDLCSDGFKRVSLSISTKLRLAAIHALK